jgi:hypothetical protein
MNISLSKRAVSLTTDAIEQDSQIQKKNSATTTKNQKVLAHPKLPEHHHHQQASPRFGL